MIRKAKAFFRLARPHQYLKNGFVGLPLFFGYKSAAKGAVSETFYTFAAFCLAASCIYIVNDIMDIGKDRSHPEKRNRPLAKGDISRNEALVFLCGLFTFTFVWVVLLLKGSVISVLALYIGINLAYSMVLKHHSIIDVVCVASGFVLRVISGGMAADIRISHWIIIMTFLLSLFLALSKRGHDLFLSESGIPGRKSLSGYNPEFVSSAMVVMSSVIIVAYIMYTVSPDVMEKHGTTNLYSTSVWVLAGILRYLQITLVFQRGGSPTRELLRDRPLAVIVILWLVNCYILLYS